MDSSTSQAKTVAKLVRFRGEVYRLHYTSTPPQQLRGVVLLTGYTEVDIPLLDITLANELYRHLDLQPYDNTTNATNLHHLS